MEMGRTGSMDKNMDRQRGQGLKEKKKNREREEKIEKGRRTNGKGG